MPMYLVICTATGKPVRERNVRRALEAAKKAKLTTSEMERLSLHSIRHSWASLLATNLEIAPTTLALLTGHTDAGFTLKVYARDARDEATVVEDVLARGPNEASVANQPLSQPCVSSVVILIRGFWFRR